MPITNLSTELLCLIANNLNIKQFNTFILSNKIIYAKLTNYKQDKVISVWQINSIINIENSTIQGQIIYKNQVLSLNFVYPNLSCENFPNSILKLSNIHNNDLPKTRQTLKNFISYYNVKRLIDFMDKNDNDTKILFIQLLEFKNFNPKQLNIILGYMITKQLKPVYINDLNYIFRKITPDKIQNFSQCFDNIQALTLDLQLESIISPNLKQFFSYFNPKQNICLKSFSGILVLNSLQQYITQHIYHQQNNLQGLSILEQEIDNFIDKIKSVQMMDFSDLPRVKPKIQSIFVEKILKTDFAPKNILNIERFLNVLDKQQIKSFVNSIRHSQFDLHATHILSDEVFANFINIFLELKIQLNMPPLHHVLNRLDNNQIQGFVNCFSQAQSMDFDGFEYVNSDKLQLFMKYFLDSNIQISRVKRIDKILPFLDEQQIKQLIQKLKNVKHINLHGMRIDSPKQILFIKQFLELEIKLNTVIYQPNLFNNMSDEQIKKFAGLCIDLQCVRYSFSSAINSNKLKLFADELINLNIQPKHPELFMLLTQLQRVSVIDEKFLANFYYLDNIEFAWFSSLNQSTQNLFKQAFFEDKIVLTKAKHLNTFIDTLDSKELLQLKPKLDYIKFDNNDLSLQHEPLTAQAREILLNN